jgi:hypothetical protein
LLHIKTDKNMHKKNHNYEKNKKNISFLFIIVSYVKMLLDQSIYIAKL